MPKLSKRTANPRPYSVILPDRIAQDGAVSRQHADWCRQHATGDWSLIRRLDGGTVQASFAVSDTAQRFRRVFCL